MTLPSCWKLLILFWQGWRFLVGCWVLEVVIHMWKRPWFCENVTFGRKVKKHSPKLNGRNPKKAWRRMEDDFPLNYGVIFRFQPLVFGGVYFEFRILKWPTASRKPLKKGKRAPNFGYFHPSPKTIHLKYNQGLSGGLWHFFWHISNQTSFHWGGIPENRRSPQLNSDTSSPC